MLLDETELIEMGGTCGVFPRLYHHSGLKTKAPNLAVGMTYPPRIRGFG
jgi:hypothetical protein